MLCEICRKQKASVARVVDRGYGEQKVAVCLTCAQNIDNQRAVNKYSEFFWGGGDKSEPEIKIERCPTCGYSLSDIKRTSYVGCKDCYKLFKKEIGVFVNSIHGKNVHVGKVPLSEAKKADNSVITSAQISMQRAIEYGDIDLAKIARKHFPGAKGDGFNYD